MKKTRAIRLGCGGREGKGAERGEEYWTGVHFGVR